MDSLHAEGQTYRDFTLTRYLPLQELHCTWIELAHKTGARVFHVANDDAENFFCLSFQTLPTSSNGVAHILEHTVLCGSKKYPVKDPFFSMSRRSLNTFMNAFTGQDFTCYPASSQVEKDFYNLLGVYLDAVFHPTLTQFSFLQEGHRLALTDVNDLNSPLQFQGIVYNEMKGALSSADSRLWKKLFASIFPDLPYAFDTGGDPKEIPNLTHEELLAFHQDFYHPSRCIFFFYGNLPLAKHLDFLTDTVLKGAKKLPPLPPLRKQSRFTALQKITNHYPIASSESLEKKGIIAFGYLTASIADQEELFALSLLDSLLLEHDASPLCKALLKSNLTTQVSSLLDPQLSEAPWAIICRGCEAEDADKIKALIDNTLQELLERPFTQEEIDACLHQFEFERSEISGDDGPFGLTLFFRAGLLAHHGIDPTLGLCIHSLFDHLKEKSKHPHFFPSLIRKYLLDNPHQVQLVLKPDLKLEAKEADEEKERLAEIRSSLQENDLQKIVEESKELTIYQEKAENQDLSCLPKLTLADIPLHVDDFLLETKSFKNLNLFHHSCFTNQILYADLLFDLPHIEVSDLPYLSLFSRLLPEVGSGGRSYEENLAKIQAHTGGISASLSLHISCQDPNICTPTFGLKGKCLERNRKELFQLFGDLIATPNFQDKERIQELISQHITSLEHRLTKNGLSYASQLCFASFSIPSYLFEKWHGLSYYQTILQEGKKIDLLIEKLQSLQQKILKAPSFDLILSSDEAQWENLQKDETLSLLNNLIPTSPIEKPWQGTYCLPKIQSQARAIATPVASQVFGTKTVSYQDPAAPYLLLATELLQNCTLHTEIREKGGAYGGGANFSPATGNFYLHSYRDPHLVKTWKAFQKGL
ncbi:MAG TPA: insulinase family protein, partial [Chlamydiales bacterium]|nr:insulinase family protein [Chlamydiales bacterium]